MYIANLWCLSMASDRQKDDRKLTVMIHDLREIHAEMNPEGPSSSSSSSSFKSMDAFQRKKYDLNMLLASTRPNVDHLCDLRKREGGGTNRSTELISSQLQNTKDLKRAGTLWTELKTILARDLAKKGKKRLPEDDLADRQRITGVLGQELVDLSNRNSLVKIAFNDNELAMEKRRVERRTKQRQERKDRKGGNKKEVVVTIQLPPPMSEQEVVFVEQVDTNVAEQELLLDEISGGLDELASHACLVVGRC